VHRAIVLARDLAEASAGASREIAAGLGARLVRAADELTRAPLHPKSRAVAVDHPHVRSIAVEPNKLVGAVAEKRVIVTRHADIRFEPRKAASSACETFWNRWQLESPGPAYAIEGHADGNRQSESQTRCRQGRSCKSARALPSKRGRMVNVRNTPRGVCPDVQRAHTRRYEGPRITVPSRLEARSLSTSLRHPMGEFTGQPDRWRPPARAC